MLIDIHTHLTHGGGRTIDHLLAHLEKYGGGKSVILPLAGGDASPVRHEEWSTESALEANEKHPDKTAAFCHLNPFDPDVLKKIEKFYATGRVKGFGEHKVKIPVDHPFSMGIYRLCGELGLPVLIHLDYSETHNYNFPVFESVIKALPNTTFIGHAMAFWSNVSKVVNTDPTSAGFENYPKGKVVRGGLTDRWLSDYPNLYADLSAKSAFYAVSRDPEFGQDFMRRHRRKIMWGSDCPCFDGNGNTLDGGYRDCLTGLMLPVIKQYAESKEQYEDITWHNAERVLKV